MALDADTGQELWSIPLGEAIHAPPIAYALNGQEQIAVVAGRSVFTFAISSQDQEVGPARLTRLNLKPSAAN
jgi:alcohol dehydrogenase (cytochrome c)